VYSGKTLKVLKESIGNTTIAFSYPDIFQVKSNEIFGPYWQFTTPVFSTCFS